MLNIFPMDNTIQEYDWGSRTFIPEMMGGPSPSNKPQAELWMGAHAKAPSTIIVDGQKVPLTEMIRGEPRNILGASTARKFSNTLPFLFKILAVERPLSIQAHPGREQAVRGFKRENELEIPLDAPHRNYRDRNHKPELLCALTPFQALIGFKSPDRILAAFQKVPAPALENEIKAFAGRPDKEGFERFFTTLMTMERDKRARIISQTVALCENDTHRDPSLQRIIALHHEYPCDVGVLSPLLLHAVTLEPGEALFIPPGTLHAYLEGAGVELMANSDNVLRGGLTRKNMDIAGLLDILDWEPHILQILTPVRHPNGEWVYPSFAEEFRLSVIKPVAGEIFESISEGAVEIVIAVKGHAVVIEKRTGRRLPLSQGTAILIPASVPHYTLTGDAILYKASVPA